MREVSYAEASGEVETASVPVVVDLHADWCGYCKTTRPHLERISAERPDDLRIVAIDTDEHADAFAGLGVKTLPTIILFRDGVEVARRGSGDYDALVEWLAENGA